MDEIVKMLDKNLEYISHELSNDTLYPAFPKFITRVAQPLTSHIEYFAYQ
mgnify:CR=1 FL=1